MRINNNIKLLVGPWKQLNDSEHESIGVINATESTMQIKWYSHVLQ